jgi:signal transduction histidine kinase/DNA-binding NarL/FixJ family response regulator
MRQNLEDIVLVIEDNPDQKKLLQLMLKEEFAVMFAVNTSMALQLIERHKIKVVISEALKIGESIINFYEKIEINYPFIQRILLTDYLDAFQLSEALDRGRIFGYIKKPIDPKRLNVVVQKAIDQYNLYEDNKRLVKNLKTKNDELKELLNELKEEEEKFRNIYNSSPDPIFILNKEGVILDHNPHSNIFCPHGAIYYKETDSVNGGMLDQLKKRKVNIIDCIIPEDQNKFLTFINNVDENREEIIEVRVISKHQENNILDFELNAYPLKYKGLKAIMISFRDISARKALQYKVMQTIIQTEEKERRRFAQELHDGIGPLLSTTKLYLQWLNKPELKMDKQTIIAKMEETLEETIASVREVSNNISPNTLISFGLNTALNKFINRIANASQIHFQYANHLSQRLPSNLEISIYRLLCECINNSLKYAEAKNIKIHIRDNDSIKINYIDDGKGFDVIKTFNESKGSGLLNMKNRVETLGGSFIIESTIGSGMNIEVTFKKTVEQIHSII